MTLQRFEELIVIADPQASHYSSIFKPNYTVWAEYGDNSLFADGQRAETAIKIQIDRFTKIEFDPVAQAITDMLNSKDAADEIAYSYECTSEPVTGYIRHMWVCEVI